MTIYDSPRSLSNSEEEPDQRVFRNRREISESERQAQLSRLEYENTKDLYLGKWTSQSDIPFRGSVIPMIQNRADDLSNIYLEATHFIYSGLDTSHDSYYRCTEVYSQPLKNNDYLLGKVNVFHPKILNYDLISSLDGELSEDSDVVLRPMPNPDLSLARNVNPDSLIDNENNLFADGSLVIILEEAVGQDYNFDKVLILTGGGYLNNTECYIQREHLQKLSKTGKSLPITTSTCRNVSNIESTICDATSPQWVNLSAPYFYRQKCEYWVTIRTEYTGAGGEQLASRKEQAVHDAIDYLLEYYDKVRDPATVAVLKEHCYMFAKATAWHIDPPPGGRLKVLVSFPAKYVDALPKETNNLNDYLESKIPDWFTTVTFRTDQIVEQINSIANLFREFESKPEFERSLYTGPIGYGDFSFESEAARLVDFIPYLRNFLRTNRKIFRTQNPDRIEIGFNEQYKIIYVLLDNGRGNVPLTVGLNYFSNNEPCNLSRTMGLIAAIHDINLEIKRKRASLKFQDFMESYIFPMPEKAASGVKKCKPDPINPMKCCDFDVAATFGDYIVDVGKNTLSKLRAGNFTNPNKLVDEWYQYQKAHISPICGGDRDPLDLYKSVAYSYDALTAAQDCARDPKKYDDYQSLAKCSQKPYEDKRSPLKKTSVKILEEEDIKKLDDGLRSCLNDGYDLISDPYLEELINQLTGRNSLGKDNQFFSSEDYEKNRPSKEKIFEYFSRIDFFSIARKALQCTCNILENAGDRLVAQAKLEELDQVIAESGENSSDVRDWWASNRPTLDSYAHGTEKNLVDEPGTTARKYLRKTSNRDASPPHRNSLIGISAGDKAMPNQPGGSTSGQLVRNTDDPDALTQPHAARILERTADALVDLSEPANAQIAHALICQDICNSVPILCSCVDLTLPSFDLPKFTVPGIFGYIVGMLLDILIDILIHILLSIIQKLIDDLLRCEFDDSEVKDEFKKVLENSVRFDDMVGVAEDINSEDLDLDLLRPYMADVPLVISPSEFCALIQGTATRATMSTLEDLLDSQHSGLRAYIRNQEQIRELFLAVGRRLGPNVSICDDLSTLTRDAGPQTIANRICDDINLDQLRENLKTGDSTPEQISEILNNIRLCRQQRTLAVADVARELSENPEGFFENMIPKIMGAPGEDSLMPRDPPELRHMVDKVMQDIFNPVKMAFDRDANGYPNTLIEYEYDPMTRDSNQPLFEGLLTNGISNISQGENTWDQMSLGSANWLNSIANLVGGADQIASAGASESFMGLGSNRVPKNAKVGHGLKEDLSQQSNFVFDPDYVRGSIASSFKMSMSPFKSFSYEDLNLEFNESDNIVEYIPNAFGRPNDQNNLITVLGIEPVESNISLRYHLPKSSFCHAWDKERDFYEIELFNEGSFFVGSDPTAQVDDMGSEERRLDSLPTGPLLKIVGEKKLNPRVKQSMEQLGYDEALGQASIPQEVFATWMTRLWNNVLPEDNRVGRDVQDKVYNRYLNDSFNKITEEMLQSMAETVSNSRFFDVDDMQKLQLSSDRTCKPPRDSLVSIDTIVTAAQNSFYNNKSVQDYEERFAMSLTEGCVYTFIRVYILEFVMSGIFAYSRFNLTEVIDDTFVRLCVKHVRDNLLKEKFTALEGMIYGFDELKQFLRNAGVLGNQNIFGLMKWHDTFYHEFLRWAQISIFQRMDRGEKFINPFTNSEVLVTTEPIELQKRISYKFEGDPLPLSNYYIELKKWHDKYSEYLIRLEINQNEDTHQNRINAGLIQFHKNLYEIEKQLKPEYINPFLDRDYDLGYNDIISLDEPREQLSAKFSSIVDFCSGLNREYLKLNFGINETTIDPIDLIGSLEALGGNLDNFKGMKIIPHAETTDSPLRNHSIRELLGKYHVMFPDSFDLFVQWVEEVTFKSNCECIPIASTAILEGQISDGEIVDGLPKMGFLEFLIMEQLDSIRFEVESYLGSQIEDINSLLLGKYNPKYKDINPIAEDENAAYFLKEIVDVPSDPTKGQTGRIPAEILNGKLLPFVLERYVKVTDYSIEFWQNLKSGRVPVGFVGTPLDLPSDKLVALYNLFAPTNRIIIRDGDSVGQLTATVSLAPPEDSNEAIVSIKDWFDWLTSKGYEFSQTGEDYFPIWKQNEQDSTKVEFDYIYLFANIQFGLRLNYVDTVNRISAIEEEEVITSLESIGFQETKRSYEDRVFNDSVDNFSDFMQETSEEIKNSISHNYKAFFLKENSFSTYRLGSEEGSISIQYPSDSVAYLSLPLIIEESRLEPRSITTAKETSVQQTNEYTRASEIEVNIPSPSNLYTAPNHAGNFGHIWKSPQDISKEYAERTLDSSLVIRDDSLVNQGSGTETYRPKVDPIFGLLFGLDLNKSLSDPYGPNNIMNFDPQILPAIEANYREDILKDVNGESGESNILFQLIREWKRNADDVIALIDGETIPETIDEIRTKEDKMFELYDEIKFRLSSIRDYFASGAAFNSEDRGTTGPTSRLVNWNLPEDNRNYPYSNTYLFFDDMLKDRFLDRTLGKLAYQHYRGFNLINLIAGSLLPFESQEGVIQEYSEQNIKDLFNDSLTLLYNKRRDPLASEKSTPLIQELVNYFYLIFSNEDYARQRSRYYGYNQSGLVEDPLRTTESIKQKIDRIIEERGYYEEYTSIPEPTMGQLSTGARNFLVGKGGDQIAVIQRNRPELIRQIVEHVKHLCRICLEEITTVNTTIEKDMVQLRISEGIKELNRFFSQNSTVDSLQQQGDLQSLTHDALSKYNSTDHYDKMVDFMLASEDYSLLTEFIFPLKRYASLTSMYTTMKISSAINYKDVFSDTKIAAKQMFIGMLSSHVSDENGRPGWYRVDLLELMKAGAFDPLPWWLRLLQVDLSFNLIEFIQFVPHKLLQLVLSVPWFSSIVDPLCSVMVGWPFFNDWTTCKELLGELPSNRGGEENTPNKVGDGNTYCGTPEEIAKAKETQRKRMINAMPNSINPPDGSDLPFG